MSTKTRDLESSIEASAKYRQSLGLTPLIAEGIQAAIDFYVGSAVFELFYEHGRPERVYEKLARAEDAATLFGFDPDELVYTAFARRCMEEPFREKGKIKSEVLYFS